MPPAKREYSKYEMNSARYFLVRICTSGLDNPKEGDEAFDYSNACPICKAGRIPKMNLQIPTNSMGEKMLDMNFRYGYLVFREEIVSKILEQKLKGINFRNISVGRESVVFKEGIVTSVFPRLSDKSIICIEELCYQCLKSGHYDTYEEYPEFWYKKKDLDILTQDFYLTWEYYGIWKMGATKQRLIISKRCKESIFDKIKQRHIKFDPIFEEH